MEEEHGILTYNGRMFSLPHFHFQFKSINISTILTSKLKCVCTFVDLILGYHLEYISWVESSVNKQICLNFVLILHRAVGMTLANGKRWLFLYILEHFHPNNKVYPPCHDYNF